MQLFDMDNQPCFIKICFSNHIINSRLQITTRQDFTQLECNHYIYHILKNMTAFGSSVPMSMPWLPAARCLFDIWNANMRCRDGGNGRHHPSTYARTAIQGDHGRIPDNQSGYGAPYRSNYLGQAERCWCQTSGKGTHQHPNDRQQIYNGSTGEQVCRR